MSDEVTFRVLDDADGPALLEVDRASPIEADFTFVFERDPDFFAWPRAIFERFSYGGAFVDGRLVAYAMFGVRTGWDGQAFREYVYIGDARTLPAFRRRGLTRGISSVLEPLGPKGVLGLGAVKIGNLAAVAALRHTPPAPGTTRGRLCTFEAVGLLLLRHRPPRPPVAGLRIRKARWQDVGALGALLQRETQGRLFAPRLDADSLARAWSEVPALSPQSFYVAERDGRAVGVMRLWDMDGLRRTRILGYSVGGRVLEGVYDAARELAHPELAPLPPPGGVLRALTATHVATEGRDPVVLRRMLEAAIDEHAGTGMHLINVGLVRGDPLRRAVSRKLGQRFRTQIIAGGPTGWEQRVGQSALRDPYIDLPMI